MQPSILRSFFTQHSRSSLRVLKSTFFMLALSSMSHHVQAQALEQMKAQPTQTVDQILHRQHTCSPTLSLRSSALSREQEQAACIQLGELEKRFHQLFSTPAHPLGPVRHDNNRSLRANIYASQAEFVQYAGQHFNMPTDNGGMYLEGLPEQTDNHAEFVAYQRVVEGKQGQVHNLGHEYIHYLDGRFNLYGDFCATLHDSHAAPEYCAQPAPDAPYLVWWTEGIAEYVSRGDDHPHAIKTAASKHYRLSELFNTAYEKNSGRERIYTWGYLATRYMMEKQRSKVDQILKFTRVGDYPRYQALVRSWGVSMDEEFNGWLEGIGTHE